VIVQASNRVGRFGAFPSKDIIATPDYSALRIQPNLTNS
jgi:hypothetical protein